MNARKSILDVLSIGLNIAVGLDMGQMARMTPGYVGADLASLLREAAINAVNRILNKVCSLQVFWFLFSCTVCAMFSATKCSGVCEVLL